MPFGIVLPRYKNNYVEAVRRLSTAVLRTWTTQTFLKARASRGNSKTTQ